MAQCLFCLDMYTDDYRKQTYIDVHCNWIDRDFSTHHTALAVKHFGTSVHTGQNIHEAIRSFRRNLRKYMDEKFWSSVVAFHWIATFLDPSFKHLEFLPQTSSADTKFKRNLQSDLDNWILAELDAVAKKLEERTSLRILEM